MSPSYLIGERIDFVGVGEFRIERVVKGPGAGVAVVALVRCLAAVADATVRVGDVYYLKDWRWSAHDAAKQCAAAEVAVLRRIRRDPPEDGPKLGLPAPRMLPRPADNAPEDEPGEPLAVLLTEVAGASAWDVRVTMRSWDLQTICWFARDLFRNLASIDAQGIAHLDVSWHNVMVDLDRVGEDGAVGLIDFDAAMPVDGSGWSRSLKRGTGSFAPPEAKALVDALFDPRRVDLYAAAVLIHWILAGCPNAVPRMDHSLERWHTLSPEESDILDKLRNFLQLCTQGTPAARWPSPTDAHTQLVLLLPAPTPRESRRDPELTRTTREAVLAGDMGRVPVGRGPSEPKQPISEGQEPCLGMTTSNGYKLVYPVSHVGAANDMRWLATSSENSTARRRHLPGKVVRSADGLRFEPDGSDTEQSPTPPVPDEAARPETVTATATPLPQSS